MWTRLFDSKAHTWEWQSKCWFSTINLLLPACSQFLHCWLLNPNTRKLSFHSSFFLTPPSNPLAWFQFHTPSSSRLYPLIAITPCLHLLPRLQEPHVFLSLLLSLLWCMFSFFWLEEEGRNCLLSKHFLVLRPLHLFQKILRKYLLCASTETKNVLDDLSTGRWVLYVTKRDQVLQQNTSLNGLEFIKWQRFIKD